MTTTKPSQYVGSLCLEFEDGQDSELYDAQVTRATIFGDEWVIEFGGIDKDSGPYSGQMRLKIVGKAASGVGEFRFAGDPPVSAMIKAKVLNKSKAQATCVGTWHEPTDSRPYELTLDLEAIKATK